MYIPFDANINPISFENNIAVPQDVLLDAYALLDDEDKEEYAGLIEKRSDTP